jgi:hypothetical protein
VDGSKGFQELDLVLWRDVQESVAIFVECCALANDQLALPVAIGGGRPLLVQNDRIFVGVVPIEAIVIGGLGGGFDLLIGIKR